MRTCYLKSCPGRVQLDALPPLARGCWAAGAVSVLLLNIMLHGLAMLGILTELISGSEYFVTLAIVSPATLTLKSSSHCLVSSPTC